MKKTEKIQLGKIKKKWIVVGVVVLLATVAGVRFFAMRSKMSQMVSKRSVLNTTVSTGTIQTSVSGTGIISYGDTTDIVVSADLMVDELLISEGSNVTAGDMIATVDEASLALCLNEVEEAISEVDSTISSESSSSISQSIKAGVAGRVKKIYADAEDNVLDIMQEQGALMLLSTDDLMMVTIENATDFAAGDEVVVKKGDTTTEGTVESVSETGTVITFEDDVFAYEDEVTIVDEEGSAIGFGKAYIHQPVKVVGTNGTISSLNVSLNSTVSSSTKVFTLTGSTKSAEYLQAITEREQLVELLNTLIAIQANGGITAPVDGMLETVNSTTASTSTESAGGYMMGAALDVETLDVAEVNVSGVYETQDIAVADTLMFSSACEDETLEVESMSIIKLAEGEFSQNDDTVSSTSNTEDVSSKENTEVTSELSSEDVPTTDASKEESDPENGNDENSNQEDSESSNKKDNQENKNSDTEHKSNEKDKTGNTTGGNSLSGGGGFTSIGSASTTSTSTSVETTSLFVIANGDKMMVTMNVDELDIGTMQVGQQAQVTLDAIEGEIFEGIITNVSHSASSSGGSSQYPVEIVFDKTENMLSGMNASVDVIVEQAENVLVVPLSAIQDEGMESYVYTEYNEADGTLGGKVQVETGLSDENNVEILSGLSEGDIIYYEMQGSEDSENEMDGFSMPGGMGNMPGGMGNMPDGGEMPNGGEMPSGGFGGENRGGRNQNGRIGGQ